MVEVGASILNADFTSLKTDIKRLEKAGVDFFHLDIMDGHLVPNISFGPDIANSLRKITELPLDAHLMLSHPLKYAEKFDADLITFHVESEDDTRETIDKIENRAKVGIAINPDTPLETIDSYLEKLHTVLIMSVHPGFGGQSFIESTLDKIRGLRKKITQAGLETRIAVDGGLNDKTTLGAIQAGADVLNIGSFLLKTDAPGTFIEKVKTTQQDL